MKSIIMIIAVLYAVPAYAQRQEAIEACRNYHLVQEWRTCIARVEDRLKQAEEDPIAREEKRRYELEQKRRAEELRLRKQEIENQKRVADELERQRIFGHSRGLNCTSQRIGNTVHTTCN
jgi:hypothetical protein